MRAACGRREFGICGAEIGALGQYFTEILSTPTSTVIALSALCGAAILILREMFSAPAVALIVYPFCVACSVLVSHAFYLYEFYAPKVMDQWLVFMVISAAIGVAATLLVFVALRSVIFSITAAKRLEPLVRRNVRHVRIGN